MLRIWEAERANQMLWDICWRERSNEFETKYYDKYVFEYGQKCRAKYNNGLCKLSM